jgi:hypothetical protein
MFTFLLTTLILIKKEKITKLSTVVHTVPKQAKNKTETLSNAFSTLSLVYRRDLLLHNYALLYQMHELLVLILPNSINEEQR